MNFDDVNSRHIATISPLLSYTTCNCEQNHNIPMTVVTPLAMAFKVKYVVDNSNQLGGEMSNNSATLTTFGVQRLQENFNYLKARYERIRQDLKDTTISNSILSIKRLERDFLIFDMRKIKKALSQARNEQTTRQDTNAAQDIKVHHPSAKSAVIKVTLVESHGHKDA